MQAYYTSQAPSSGGAYYGNAIPGAQPPHPYAMWPGQPMMPYGAAPPSFYPGTMFAHPGAQPGQPGVPYGTYGAPGTAPTSATPRGAGDGEEGEPAGVDANGKQLMQPPGSAANGAPPTGNAPDGRVHQMGMPPMELMAMDGSQAQAAAMGQPGQQIMALPQAMPQAPPGVIPGGEYWQAQAAQHGQPPHAGGNSELWMDERELKRQRRKQSNRESARRSRLRKQAECEDLSGRVEKLVDENSSLRQELTRLKDACGVLTTDKTDLEANLSTLRGGKGEAASKVASKDTNSKKAVVSKKPPAKEDEAEAQAPAKKAKTDAK